MEPVEPPDPSALDESVRDLVALTGVRNDGEPLAIIEVLSHRPDLVGPFLHWSASLSAASALGPRRHELAAMRASWHCGSDYEWGNHARAALAVGVEEAELDALGRVDGAASFSDEGDRLVIELVDEMLAAGDDSAADGGARDRLRAQLGDAALVDLVWAVGQYVGLSLVADTLALPIGDLRRAPPRSTG